MNLKSEWKFFGYNNANSAVQLGAYMSTLVVRKALAEDLKALFELYRQLSSTPSTPELPSLAEAVKAINLISAQPWMQLLVAVLEETVVGTVTVVVVPNVTHSARPWAQIENMVVHENHRRAGVGHALMARCEEIAREAGCYKMQLQSRNQRQDAHAFYEREGFSPSTVGFRRYF